jgi:aminopeptidase N
VLHLGFARYLQFIGANSSLTQSGVMDRYTIDVIQLAMAFDAGPNTEPVRSNVTDEITNQNSRIIYEKGASLLRMMQGFLTEETLIAALRNYLDKQ